MNFSWKKKTSLVFFFSRFFPQRGRKKTQFLDLNERMANVHAQGKKNTISTFASTLKILVSVL